MNFMPVHEAWAVLGKDANLIMEKVSSIPRKNRPEALASLVKSAKRIAKNLMMEYHPDRGGDSEKFRKVQLAISSIIHHTDEFMEMSTKLVKISEEVSSRRSVLIDVKK